MQTASKLALISFSVLAALTLSACQSTQSTPVNSAEPQHRSGHHHDRSQMTDAQKQHWQQQSAGRKQLFNQMQQACDGKKLGQNLQLQVADKTISGQCQLMFKPEARVGTELHTRQHQPHTMRMQDQNQHPQGRDKHNQAPVDPQNMSAEQIQQRELRQQQFALRRAERQQKWQALQNACNGQTVGKNIQAQIGDKTLNGQCVVKFKPDLNAMHIDHKTPKNNT
ncbi:hypothetical protein EC844_106103 [Acinetobacter calcoaceticus]|uniref:Uncharacterized protein n=1 Tax=Acinetobacter calcoaceticus TaxID=471 RepID=A0A4R1XZL0_ACICA|nr:hypothetical protein EC844_106103 [Acinetobacter calcoaceticus]